MYFHFLPQIIFCQVSERPQDASHDDNDDDVSNDRNIKWDRKDERYEYDRLNN